MLVTVTDEAGTGMRAQLEGVAVAGKTGTAQKFDKVSGSYSHEDYAGWFLGMAPAEDPRVVVVTMVDEPRGKGAGGAARRQRRCSPRSRRPRSARRTW